MKAVFSPLLANPGTPDGPLDPRALGGPPFILEAVDALAVLYQLSLRERDVVLHAAHRGASMKEVAAEIGTSRKTVEQYWRRIYRKTGCQTQLEVIAELLRVAGGVRTMEGALRRPGGLELVAAEATRVAALGQPAPEELK